MEEYIEYDIKNNKDDNLIFFLSEAEEEKYEKIKKKLEEDCGFLDVVVDFNDFHKLYNVIKSVSNKYDLNLVRNTIIKQYVLYKIMNKINILEYPTIGNIDKIKDNIFGDDFESVNKNNTLSYQGVDELLKNKSLETENKQARIHFLLDSVYDKYLQRCINDLYVYNYTHSVVMGYTTLELRSHLNTNGIYISPYYEYRGVYSERKKDEIKRRMVK